MRKIFTIFLTTFSIFSFSQQNQSISLNSKSNKIFLKDSATYKLKDYKLVFKNAEALKFASKARTNRNVGDILAVTGGFGIGFGLAGVLFTGPSSNNVSSPYGTVVFKNDKSPFWVITGVGAGLALISIPFYIGEKKNLVHAVALENAAISQEKPQAYFKFESKGSLIALSYNF